MESYNQPFVYLIARVALGCLFFFQAYVKVFRLRLENVHDEVHSGTKEAGIPSWFSRLSVYATSYLELIGGALLVLGLFTTPLLYVFGAHLVLLFIAFGYLDGIWDVKHVLPRFILLLLLLLLPADENIFSLDGLLFD